MGRKPREQKFSKRTAAELFTDRTVPQDLFWEKYRDVKEDPGSWDIIHFYGDGGIGKSTLLKKIMDDLTDKEKNGNVILFSFEATQDKTDFLSAVAREIYFRVPGADFRIFYYAYKKYLKSCGYSDDEIEAKIAKNKNGVYVSESIKTAINYGADFLPFGGNTVAKAGELLVDIIQEGVERIREKGKTEDRDLIKKIDLSNQDELISDLEDYFVHDCEKILADVKEPFVLMLDGYEFLNDTLRYGLGDIIKRELWLSGTANRAGVVGSLPNVLWVIAGREKIKWNEEILPSDCCHPLENLPKEDVIRYFSNAKDPEGVPMSEELKAGLYSLTGGMPVFMDMCFEEYETGACSRIEEFGRDTGDIAARYLANMTDEQQTAMKFLCALPHMWTDEMVGSVLKGVDSDEPYDISVKMQIKKIREHSFVECTGDGYKLHDTLRLVVRDVMDQGELRKISDTSIRYLLDIINDDDIPRGERIEKFRQLESNVDEYLKVLNKTDDPADTDIPEMIAGSAGMLAGFYEDAEIWGEAINYRQKSCRFWEKYAGFIDGWKAGLADEERKIADDHFSRFMKLFRPEDADACMNYAAKACKDLLEVYAPDEWPVLYADLELIWYSNYVPSEMEDTGELERFCFEAVKKKPASERERVFRYLGRLWNYTGRNNVDLFSYLEDMISDGIDRTDPQNGDLIEELRGYRKDLELSEDEGYQAWLDDQGEDFDAYRDLDEEDKNENLEAYNVFIREYCETKEYGEAQIIHLQTVVNHLEHFYRYDEAFEILQKLYEIIKRQAGGQDTADTVKTLFKMACNREEIHFGDPGRAEEILKRVYDLLKKDPELEKDCPKEEVLLKLAQVEELLEKPSEALIYYEMLRSCPGSEEYAAAHNLDVDDKIKRLKGL